MAGVKGRSGGARPNSGRKRKVVEEWQHTNLLVFQAVFTHDDIRRIAEKQRDLMLAGDKDAIRNLAYVIGPPPKEIAIIGDKDAPLKVEIEYVRTESHPNNAT